MQDMHGVGDGSGGGGRFFSGGDRRLRPHGYPNHQALKCPRCDSLNTKFCYYNNYNLSQPRHFCKSCRRYWTKGGVLRNVPVGGGCRKTKRSKPKSSPASSAGDAPRESKSNAQSSSSESSSLTAAATSTIPTSASTAVVEEGSAPSTEASDSAVVYNIADTRFCNVNPQPNPSFNHQPLVNNPSTDGQIFSDEIGSFSSLMTSQEEMMPFGLGEIRTTQYPRAQQMNHAPEAENPGPGSTAVDEFKMEDMSNEGLPAILDWGSGGDGGDQSLFDLTAGMDPAYWNQSQWTDNDQSLNYLP
ncbi:hypothetical protein CDL12_22945 [Handroanthus impetiginosus]|uniref:Dof zinc finger protein n=1 Tax=Handroanthus impetiginosus TaxID=429701 RepID=A0A2G9GGV1_9LAMI|nr:hypothetical protein CDL12_22945 [Handroanthus impetiginosus]